MLDEALALARVSGERMLLGYTLDSLGALAEARDELGRAAGLYQEALAMAQEFGNPFNVAMALRALAGVAAKWGQPASAARIWGVTSALGEAIGSTLPLEEQARFEATVSSVREQLGEDAFTAALEEGRALPLEQAVAEALTLAAEIATDDRVDTADRV
jgi:hypothetical protein